MGRVKRMYPRRQSPTCVMSYAQQACLDNFKCSQGGAPWPSMNCGGLRMEVDRAAGQFTSVPL